MFSDGPEPFECEKVYHRLLVELYDRLSGDEILDRLADAVYDLVADARCDMVCRFEEALARLGDHVGDMRREVSA